MGGGGAGERGEELIPLPCSIPHPALCIVYLILTTPPPPPLAVRLWKFFRCILVSEISPHSSVLGTEWVFSNPPEELCKAQFAGPHSQTFLIQAVWVWPEILFLSGFLTIALENHWFGAMRLAWAIQAHVRSSGGCLPPCFPTQDCSGSFPGLVFSFHSHAFQYGLD